MGRDDDRTISASEVGAFAFRSRAWYLERIGVRPDGNGVGRRLRGSRAHRRIGRRTDLLRAGRVTQRALLLLIVALAALALAALAGIGP